MVEGANPWWAKRIFAVEIFETLARFDERSVKRTVVRQNTIRARHQVTHRYPEAFLFKGLRKTCDWNAVDMFSGVGVAAGECGEGGDGCGELQIVESDCDLNDDVVFGVESRRFCVEDEHTAQKAHSDPSCRSPSQ